MTHCSVFCLYSFNLFGSLLACSSFNPPQILLHSPRSNPRSSNCPLLPPTHTHTPVIPAEEDTIVNINNTSFRQLLLQCNQAATLSVRECVCILGSLCVGSIWPSDITGRRSVPKRNSNHSGNLPFFLFSLNKFKVPVLESAGTQGHSFRWDLFGLFDALRF